MLANRINKGYQGYQGRDAARVGGEALLRQFGLNGAATTITLPNRDGHLPYLARLGPLIDLNRLSASLSLSFSTRRRHLVGALLDVAEAVGIAIGTRLIVSKGDEGQIGDVGEQFEVERCKWRRA